MHIISSINGCHVMSHDISSIMPPREWLQERLMGAGKGAKEEIARRNWSLNSLFIQNEE